MDCVEDSGFDSDQQKPGTSHPTVAGMMANSSCSNGSSAAGAAPPQKPTTQGVVVAQIHTESLPRSDLNPTSGLRQAVEIHRRPGPDKQRNTVRKTGSGIISQQPRNANLSRNRLLAPSKFDVASASDMQPLVVIDMDESEDEFAHPKLSKKAQQEITQQLIKDGYNLDLEPDDEDLDLIPPRPLNERCTCCNAQVNCGIQ